MAVRLLPTSLPGNNPFQVSELEPLFQSSGKGRPNQHKSVNDGIDLELCSMHYLWLDKVLEEVVHCRKGSLLAKMDIERAYRMVPTSPG
jgi:hypothetical protein